MTTTTGAVDGDRTPGATPGLSRWAVPLICVAQLMATLDVTIVNLALPAIDGALGLTDAGLAWVIDAYTLAYAGLLLVGGRLGDLVGRRRTLMIGIGLFTGASLVAGLAHDPAVLLAARAGQGVGAAFATPTTLALITALVPAGAARARAMVAYGAMAGLGITLGLVLGGLLTEYASWRWVFLVNVPIGLGLLVSVRRVLPESRGVHRRVDLLGAGLGTAGLTALVYGVIRAGSHDGADHRSVVALAAATTLLGAFVAVELRVPEPTLPLHLLRHRTRLAAYLIAGLLFACLYPSFLLLSRSLQEVQGLGPVTAGLRFLPIGVGVLAFAILARRLLARVGARPLVLVGTTAATVGAAGLVALDRNGSYALVLLPCLVGLGAGVGTTFVANAALAMTDVAADDTGIASGLLSTFQAVGGTVGVAALASIASSSTADRIAASDGPLSVEDVRAALLAGFGDGFTLAAALAAVATAVAVVLVLTGARGGRR
ncbi:MFS transporter [Nocardioides nitrophenolicus]|uniref:MFS transporter n=1 Tax=Nocardioides nitrophenolicus TaxID=60489 RepID=UPI00195D5D28|nr:MFS transporter [Nocardioides nitrophenolicus]MBM7517737.1 EmrB/QacA subfamily drug resistance transporter [Nocardioides nitrophenolicus]